MVKAEVRIIDPDRPNLNKTYICYPTETHIINDGTTTYEFHFNFQFPAIQRRPKKMTNEEAIELLKIDLEDYEKEFKASGIYKDDVDCLKLAIAALERVEDCKDNKYMFDRGYDCGYEKGFEAGKRYIVEQMCALLEKEVQE